MQKFIFNFGVDNKNSLKAAFTNFGKNFPQKVTKGFTDFFSTISNLLKSQLSKNSGAVNSQAVPDKVSLKTLQKNSLFLNEVKLSGTDMAANDFTHIKNNILNPDNTLIKNAKDKESAQQVKTESVFDGKSPNKTKENTGNDFTVVKSSIKTQIVNNDSGSEKSKITKSAEQGENQVIIPEIDFKTFVRLINNIAKNQNNDFDQNPVANTDRVLNENLTVNLPNKSENNTLVRLAAESKKVQKTVFNLVKAFDGIIKNSTGTVPVKSQIDFGGKFITNKIEFALKGNEVQISAPEKLQNKINKALPYVKELVNKSFVESVTNTPGEKVTQNHQNKINTGNRNSDNKEIDFKLLPVEKQNPKKIKTETQARVDKSVSTGNPGVENKAASTATFENQTLSVKNHSVTSAVKPHSVKLDFSEKIKEINQTAKVEENIRIKTSSSKTDSQKKILTKMDEEPIKTKSEDVHSSRILRSNKLKDSPELKPGFTENAEKAEILSKKTIRSVSEEKSQKAEDYINNSPERSLVFKTTMRDILKNFGVRTLAAKKPQADKTVKINTQSMATVAVQPVIQKQETKIEGIKSPDKAVPVLTQDNVFKTNGIAKKDKHGSFSAKNEQKTANNSGFDFQQAAIQNTGEKNKFFALEETSPNKPEKEVKHTTNIHTQKVDENQVFGKEQILKTVQTEIPKAAGVVKYISNIINNYYESPTSSFRQSQIIVDGGKLGDLDIRFKEHASSSSILIVVENDSIKSEMQRLLPMIADNLNSKGVNINAINIDVGQSDQKNEKQNSSKKSHNKYVSQTEENNDQKSALKQTRYYGYNTMDIVA